MIELMSQDTKERIRDLEGQKVMLNDELEITNSAVNKARIEEELMEIDDTIRKLTVNNGRF